MKLQVEGHEYSVYRGMDDEVILSPTDGDGSDASSAIPTDDYRYTHGGGGFRAACDKAREIAASGVAVPDAPSR